MAVTSADSLGLVTTSLVISGHRYCLLMFSTKSNAPLQGSTTFLNGQTFVCYIVIGTNTIYDTLPTCKNNNVTAPTIR